jgi:class 3 adenylate cyclase
MIEPPPIPLNEPDSSSRQITRVNKAIAEVSDKQVELSHETYTQVLLALYERRRSLLTSSRNIFENEPETHPDDEIRWVTVMFIDVVDSTKIAEQIDIENWRTVLGEAHRRFGDAVKRWGGEIGQYLGDGLMCYFGARRSQGNDAARAVSCALAMQNTISDYHAELKNIYGIDNFVARVGISTGRVVVGTIGSDQKVDLLAMGATTNLASRLQAICPPGEVLVDRETYRHTRAEFDFSTQEPTFLKGFTEPIDHYLVTGEQDQNGAYLTTNRIGDIVIPFVGRARLVASILQQMHDVERHHDFLMLTVFGDIGIGKSRLLQEIALSEAAEHFYTVRMIGHYEQRDMRFSLLRDMLGAVCGLSPSMSVREMEDAILGYTHDHWDAPDAEMAASIIGYAAGYGFHDTPYIQSLQHTLPHKEDKQIYGWMRRWLQGIAGTRPILLLVDNLQWADTDSLQLLNNLQDEDLGGIIVLAAARPEFRIEANLYLNKIHRQDVTLSPLSNTFTRRMIDAVLHHVDGTHQRLVDLIVERAEGNPLFVEEFLRMLFDNGVFKHQPDEGRWRLDELQYGIVKKTTSQWFVRGVPGPPG